jgi:hypothetical protein
MTKRTLNALLAAGVLALLMAVTVQAQTPTPTPDPTPAPVAPPAMTYASDSVLSAMGDIAQVLITPVVLLSGIGLGFAVTRLVTEGFRD